MQALASPLVIRISLTAVFEKHFVEAGKTVYITWAQQHDDFTVLFKLRLAEFVIVKMKNRFIGRKNQ